MIRGYTPAMIDEAPVPTDSLGSLFDFAAWLYPRVWVSFALNWAVILLPVGIAVLVVERWGPGGVGGAVQQGAWGRALVLAGTQALYWLVLMCSNWINMSTAEAAARDGESSFGEAVSRTASRLPAQLWTLISTGIRIMPMALAGGIVAGLTMRDSPLTAIGAVLLISLPVTYFTVRWSLSSYVALFEGISGGLALRRSSELSGRRFWLFAFHFCLLQALAVTPSIILSVGGLKVFPIWAAALFAPAASALVIAPFSNGLFLALYRRETSGGAAAAAPEAPPVPA